MTREMDKETITKTLLGFWKEVLGQEVSAEDEFFNIGGSSLTMFQLLGKISEVFSLEIEPEEFIEMASVRNIASYIAQILNKKENEKLKDKGKIIPPSVVQEAYYIGRNQEYDLGGISTHAYYGTVQGHFSCSDSCSRGDIDYCLMKCLSTKIEDMSNLISSDWIRPEDLCYYEKLCEETDNFNLSIKLVERTKSTKFLTRVVEAYARRQYKGNLLDILLWPKSDDMVVKTEPTAEEMKTMAELYNISQMFNYSKIFDLPNIYIDNTKLDGFLKKFVDDYACNHKICVSKQNIDVTDSNYCSYCSSWVQRAIIYNGEQVEKWIDNCREFEKALDRSEVFRSVL